jgi:undecaprenyl diphosphate synthase
VPRHVALIMDGNGRWAAARGLPRAAGHRAGAEAAERLVRFVGRRLGIEYLTLFAFSTENWSRPRAEIDDLMELLRHFIDVKIGEFVDAGIRLRVIGEIDGLPPRLAETVRDAIGRTEAGEKLHLTIALNYGSRQEIVRACREIGSELAAGALAQTDIDGDSRSRSGHSDERRDAAVELPSVAGCVCGASLYEDVLAGLHTCGVRPDPCCFSRV